MRFYNNWKLSLIFESVSWLIKKILLHFSLIIEYIIVGNAIIASHTNYITHLWSYKQISVVYIQFYLFYIIK